MSRRALCRWCIALAVFFAAYFALRTSRAAMTALWYGAVLPAEQWLGRLCGRLTLSVGEVLILTAVFCAILWLANVPRRIIAARGRHWGMALHLTLTALCAVLTVYAGFCLTWGIGYNTDSFQEKSGIHARPSTAETLAEVTAYFAGNLAACADDVPRDESGVCTLDRQAVLNRSGNRDGQVYCNGSLRYDFAGKELVIGETRVALTPTELRLLELFLNNRRQVLTREMLLARVWDDKENYVEEKALAVNIRRLREKIEEDPGKPCRIKTVFGIGYKWEEQ